MPRLTDAEFLAFADSLPRTEHDLGHAIASAVGDAISDAHGDAHCIPYIYCPACYPDAYRDTNGPAGPYPDPNFDSYPIADTAPDSAAERY